MSAATLLIYLLFGYTVCWIYIVTISMQPPKMVLDIFVEPIVRCIICACFRSEGYYLQDWVDYHLELGFSRIYLFDNNIGNDDLEYVYNISRNRRVDIINRRNAEYKQPEWYAEIYALLGPNDWGLFIDIDEYLTFKEGMTLEQYVKMAMSTACQQVKINWLTYGNNGQIVRTPGSVRERFPHPVSNRKFRKGGNIENSHTKAFIRGGLSVTWYSMHWASGSIMGCNSNFRGVTNEHPRVRRPVWDTAWIRHYQSRSEQEWCWKMKRWNHTGYDWNNYNSVNAMKPNKPRTGLISDNCTLIGQQV